MDWQLFLVELYNEVCESYDYELSYHCQRLSNNYQPKFSDCEVITCYLFGLIKKRHELTEIHGYIAEHWSSWFPNLPVYKNFVVRLNNLHAVFPVFLNRLQQRFILPNWLIAGLRDGKLEGVTDTMPIIMAQGSRSYHAKVATEFANRGYCATKKLKYHGVKFSFLGIFIPKRLPLPKYSILSPAADSDLTLFKEQIAPTLFNMRVFADKIYNDDALEAYLREEQNVELLPIQKRNRGQMILHADDELFNTMKSQCRQPVESFFNWIHQKTGIQAASKVRSTKGLFSHVWGRLTAAFLILIMFNS